MQVNSCEHRGTLKLLPFGGHKRQRVVVGDDSSTVLCFGIKKFESRVHFSTSLDSGTSISDVYVTRGMNGDSSGRIFTSSGTSIAGINKKGKVYFSFKSNMSEAIENLHVENRHIWATGEYVFCSFDENGRELHYYMCPDRINHMLMLQTPSVGKLALLGCQDSTLRIVRGDRLELDVAVSGAVKSVAEFHSVPFRARTLTEEDPGQNRRGSLLGRFRKGKGKKKAKRRGKDNDKFEDSDAGLGDEVEGKEVSNLEADEPLNNNASALEISKENLAEGKVAVAAVHDDAVAGNVKTSFIYGTTTGGIGAISVEDGMGKRSWFVQPPVSGEAR